MFGLDSCVLHQAYTCCKQHDQVRLSLGKSYQFSLSNSCWFDCAKCSCVLMIELCGIVCEAVAFNQYRPTLELIDLVELVLSYLHTIYVALSKSMSATVNAVFSPSIATLPLIKLSEYRFADSAFREIVVDESYCQVPDRQLDSYGIDMAKAATDLLAAIKRVAQHCHSSSDERLQSFTTL